MFFTPTWALSAQTGSRTSHYSGTSITGGRTLWLSETMWSPPLRSWTRNRSGYRCGVPRWRARSAPPSSGTTSSCTTRPPRWFSRTCSFPPSSAYAGAMQSFATYAVGFAARPVGAAIFGHWGDRIGRKTTLIITLLVMGISSRRRRHPARDRGDRSGRAADPGGAPADPGHRDRW